MGEIFFLKKKFFCFEKNFRAKKCFLFRKKKLEKTFWAKKNNFFENFRFFCGRFFLWAKIFSSAKNFFF